MCPDGTTAKRVSSSDDMMTDDGTSFNSAYPGLNQGPSDTVEETEIMIPKIHLQHLVAAAPAAGGGVW